MPDKMFLKKNAVCDIIDVYVNTEVKACFKRNRLYSETLGVCVVDNIVSLAASKREKPVLYYVLKPVFEDKVSYIPVEHHRVVLRDMFTGEEALKLKETEQYEKDKHLRQAVDYVLDKVAIK